VSGLNELYRTGLSETIRVRWYHPPASHCYYIFLHGRGALYVNGREVPVAGGQVVMVEPREPHRFAWIDPEVGLQWVIVKERSAAESKVIVPEGD